MRTVPRTVARPTATEGAGTAFGGGDPVAGIAGITVAGIAIVGRRRIVDKVITCHGPPGEIGVIKPNAGVQYRDDHGTRPGGDIPSVSQVATLIGWGKAL